MRLASDRLYRLSRFLPILRWLPSCATRGALRADVLAGLTGAIVVLPQGVAFATLAGMPPEYALYAAMVPCVVAAVFGSSRLMITGPANAISLTTLALIAPLATPGSALYVSLVLTLTFLVGSLQLALGVARAGRLIDYVPHSVIVGFTAGAAVLIINSQIGPFLGLGLPRGASVVDNVSAAFAQVPNVTPAAPLVGSVTIFAMLAWRPLSRWIPAMFAGVVIGAFVAWLLARYVPQWPALSTVQALPSALPPVSTPDLSFDTLRLLFSATLVMTLLALTEAIAIARAVATNRRQARRQSGIHWPGIGKPRRLLLFILSGQRFVQPLRCEPRVRSTYALRSDLRDAFSDRDSFLRCSARALSALRGDRGSTVSGGVGIDRLSRDPANLGGRSARTLADACNIYRDHHAVARMGDSSGITVALLAQRFSRPRA